LILLIEKKRTWWIVLALYSAVLLYVLYFRSFGATYPYTYVEYLMAMHNIIPFKFIYVFLSTPYISTKIAFRFALNLFGNIILFIPAGIVLPQLFIKLQKLSNLLLFIFTASIIFEACQLLTMLGIFDIDDMILYIFGTIIGFSTRNFYMHRFRK